MLYVLLNTGLSTNFTTCFFQIGGVLSSFFSVSKFCAEWHLYTAFNLESSHDMKIPTEVWSVFKAMLFFAPHLVFRTASLAFVTAFFRFYVLIPLSIYTVTSISILTFTLKGDIKMKFMFLPAHLLQFPFSIFTPTVLGPYRKSGRRQLKITMLISTLLLLPCLLLIRLLALLPSSTIHCTLGLSHININSEDIPECSPCFFNQTTYDNIKSGNNISAKNFAGSGK